MIVRRREIVLLICAVLVDANQLSWSKYLERALPHMPTTIDVKKADSLAPKIYCKVGLNMQTILTITGHSIKTTFIDLKDDFYEYLLQDGLFLPEGVEQGSNPEAVEVDPNNQPVQQEQVIRPRFNDLVDAISKAIEDLGGEIFPKLNWSAPNDFVVHDLCHAFDACADGPNASETTVSVENKRRPARLVLALRKWFDLKTSMEFRCFVHEEFLLGISQRDCSSNYEFLVEWRKEDLEEIHEALKGNHLICYAAIKNKPTENTIRPPAIGESRTGQTSEHPDEDHVASAIDDLLLSQDVELRLVDKGTAMRPGVGMYSRLPADLRDVPGGTVDELLDWCQAANREATNSS
eukprot:754872-Hanusia_phi.AAC.5